MLPQTSLQVQALEDRLVPSSTLNLTTAGSSGSINGALFSQFAAPESGTGGAEPFLRLRGEGFCGGTEQGYNTDHRPLQFDERRNPLVTHSLRVADVPTVTIGGVAYKEFLLDINQRHGRPRLSLDELRLYVGDRGNLHNYRASTHRLAGNTPVYDLDAGGNHRVKLNDRLNEGRGTGDMLFYVPASALAGGEFVYLYSKFGQHNEANGRFEQWCTRPGTVVPPAPEPGSISGIIYDDQILNGQQDEGELGLPNMTVYIDANDNGLFDQGEVFTLTDSDGAYTLADLPGEEMYTLRILFDASTGWSSQPIEVFVGSGEDVTGLNVGVNLSPPS